jgi:hypothetical protein
MAMLPDSAFQRDAFADISFQMAPWSDLKLPDSFIEKCTGFAFIALSVEGARRFSGRKNWVSYDHLPCSTQQTGILTASLADIWIVVLITRKSLRSQH